MVSKNQLLYLSELLYVHTKMSLKYLLKELELKNSKSPVILSPCLFNLCAEYIMKNAGLEEAQAGIKIAGRNTSNLRYTDDTTLMAESQEELESLLMKVKEKSEKVGLKLNIQEN